MKDRKIEKCNSICGMLTLYYPHESFVVNISTYIDYIDKLYIVDNTIDYSNKIHFELLNKYPKVEILSSGINRGIAAALNLCIEVAKINQYAWMMTMDQDSYFDIDQAKRFINSLHLIDTTKVAVLSPSHSAVTVDKKKCEYEKKEIVMTSGNLLNISLTNDIGLFNEDLFIDGVDHDYCLRANILGFQILQSINCFLHHEVGTLYSASLLFGFRKRMFHLHSPKRMYFIVRNSLYIDKQYRKAFPDFIKKQNKAVKAKISKSLRYGNNKGQYVKYIVKAYIDYYFHKYGNKVNI